MAELSGQGVTVELPSGWEGRIFRRPMHGETHGEATPNVATGPSAPPGATTNSVVHLANIPLPTDVGDFGSGAVEQLRAKDALIVLFEYDPASAGTKLFARQGVPRSLSPSDFRPDVLQRTLPGQAGTQIFFSEADRAYCLYVVLGGYGNRENVVPTVNQILQSVQIAPRPGSGPLPTTTMPPVTAASTTALDVVTNAGDLRTFAGLLATAGMSDTLGRLDPVTVFVPNDAAFGAVTDLDALRSDKGRLTRLLDYHLVHQRVPIAALQAGQPLPTVEGHDLRVASVNGAFTVNGAAILRPDVFASNGVVHVIDAMLRPEGL